MRAVYLSGPTVYLRALTAGDADTAAAWYDSPFPINATRAAEVLREQHQDPWARTRRLAIVRNAGDEVVGSVRVRLEQRGAELDFYLAPWTTDGDTLRADALRLLVPWLRGELECLVVDLRVPADQPATMAAAGELGMREAVHLREHVARAGHRVDLVIYQAVDPALEGSHA